MTGESKVLRFQVCLIEHEEGFTVLCPELPGCVSEGDNEAEALENITDAINCYMESVAMTKGLPATSLPAPSL